MCGSSLYRSTTMPDGDVALAVRFPATGDKIGSLVINPGGPGESGIEAALGVFQTLPKLGARKVSPGAGSTPRGSGVVPAGDLVQLRLPTATGCGPSRRLTTAGRVWRTSRTRDQSNSSRSLCGQDGKNRSSCRDGQHARTWMPFARRGRHK